MADDRKITINAVGDIMLGDLPCNIGFGVSSMIEKRGSLFPFEQCTEILKKGDIVFGNLEVVLSKYDMAEDPFPSIVLRGQPESAEGLSAAGFNILSLANNHIMQHGRRAVDETIDTLKRYGIEIIGLEISEKAIKNSVIIEKKGIKFGFLGYNQRPQQYFVDSPLYVAGHPEIILNDIKELKKNADIIIVSLHWGDEFIDYPSIEQAVLAHKIIDSGANIILGHHPHILQGIETYGNGIIAYSLGNFIFDMNQPRFRKTIILTISIDGLNQIKYDIVPVMINSNYQPLPLDEKSGAAIISHVEALSSKINEAELQAQYQLMLDRELKRYRREIYWHYLTHLHKYSPRLIVSNFVGAVKRRLI